MQTSIIDPRTSQPFNMDELETLQTEDDARVGTWLRRHPDHPSQGLTPVRLVTLMREAEQGNLTAMADLAADMEDKDAHMMSELAKRRRAILTIPWSIQAPKDATPEEKADAEWIEEQLRAAPWFDQLLIDATDGILKSFSASEMEWVYEGGQHLIQAVHHREQGMFQTHPDNRNELRLRDDTANGQALRPAGWFCHVHRSRSGYLHRAGLAVVLAWPFLFKNYALRDLAEFLEIYGLPIRLGKYPSGASPKEKATLLRAVMSIGHNAGGIIPQGMEIDFKNAASGASDPFMAMITWCEKSQSKAILGATLTSGADGKSSTNALGKIHQDVMDDICISDARQVAGSVTRDIISPLYALNGRSYRNPRRCPRFAFELEQAEDIKLYSEALPALAEVMDIPVEWAHNRLQIPQPKAGEAVLRPRPAKPAAPTALRFAALKAAPADQHTYADLFRQALATEAQPAINAWLRRIEELAAQADSLPALQELMLAEFDDLSEADLVKVMETAMSVARLAGMAEVADGS